jgi:hypothetical protein
LLKSDVIELFSEFYLQIEDKQRINEFVKGELNSISPKTRIKAGEFIKEYNL